MKKFRLKHNYTQAQLAKMIGVSRSTYSCWEVGLRKPTLGNKIKLAFFFFKFYIGIRQKV
jgi:DNA-binding XRE family transcriptional regulator